MQKSNFMRKLTERQSSYNSAGINSNESAGEYRAVGCEYTVRVCRSSIPFE